MSMSDENEAYKNNTDDGALTAALAMTKKIKKRQKVRCVPNCGRGGPRDIELMEGAIKENWKQIQAEINGDSKEEQDRIRDLFNAFDPECTE